MHAYAGDDPVFRAMNRRGQRETGGALGSFCVGCHAPLAVRSGATTDGLNLDSLPAALRGVGCYFCHSVAEVTADHNNPLGLAADGVLRAGLSDPLATAAHPSAYSALHDRQGVASSSLCGSCHDIVTAAGVALERTYQEWLASVYSRRDPARPAQLQTCGKCHMPGASGLAAAVAGAPTRLIHDHTMNGVDAALTDFPNQAAQRQAIDRDLLPALSARLCVMPDQADTAITVTLDNVAVGHMFPSGAAQDRRAWVELAAYRGGRLVHSSGLVSDPRPVTDLTDGDLWLLRDTLLDAGGAAVPMFWQARSFRSSLLPPSVTNDPGDPRYFHSVKRDYRVSGVLADRVTVRVRLTPVGFDVLADLVRSGDLDPAVVARMATIDLGATVVEWTLAGGYGCQPS